MTPGARVVALQATVRRYAWGSRTAIPALIGAQPDGRPVAELWFGAHPDDPAAVPEHGATLDALIAGDPLAWLGPVVVGEFGPRLPFLLKVLSADSALSIQVHPTRAQAEAGFAAEDDAGVPRDAPERNYRDVNHKPELICALTPFDALCGFRPVPETRALLAELALPELGFLDDLLSGPEPLRAAFTALLTVGDPAPLLAALADRVAGATEGPRYAARLAGQDFPGDIGAALSLLLNYVRLEAGEAIYLGAGNVHAYLRGTGVEIMANSDNVLRCGLTGKHVDVAELLAVTDFSPLTEPRVAATGGAFDVAVPDFRLASFEVQTAGDAGAGAAESAGAMTVDDPGPCIVLCTSGQLRVAEVPLSPGRAAFVPAGVPAVVAGAGQVFVAGVGSC